MAASTVSPHTELSHTVAVSVSLLEQVGTSRPTSRLVQDSHAPHPHAREAAASPAGTARLRKESDVHYWKVRQQSPGAGAESHATASQGLTAEGGACQGLAHARGLHAVLLTGRAWDPLAVRDGGTCAVARADASRLGAGVRHAFVVRTERICGAQKGCSMYGRLDAAKTLQERGFLGWVAGHVCVLRSATVNAQLRVGLRARQGVGGDRMRGS